MSSPHKVRRLLEFDAAPDQTILVDWTQVMESFSLAIVPSALLGRETERTKIQTFLGIVLTKQRFVSLCVYVCVLMMMIMILL